jgi:hypothetical protein
VHSGDDEQVKRTGALKADALRFVQSGAVTKQHRVQHTRVVLAEAHDSGKAAICLGADVIDHAFGSPTLCGIDPALQLCSAIDVC